MKSNTKLALGLIAATAMAGAFAVPAMAHGHGDGDGHSQGMTQGGNEGHGESRGGNEGHGMGGAQGMMQMMQKMQKMMQGGGMMGGGMGGGMGGHGQMGTLLSKLDSNGDGTVTADEARAGLTALLKKYDADGNGTLSLGEFEALNSAMNRERMVDRFQALDNDGDGQVTGDEMTAPADRIAKMQAIRAQRGGTPDGKSGKMPGGMMGGTAPETESN